MSGHNWSYEGYTAPLLVSDPGNAGNLYCSGFGQVVPLVSGASAETRTLKDPDRAGLLYTLTMKTDGGGDITVTADTAYNANGTTTIVFADAGDTVVLVSVEKGSAFVWRQLTRQAIDAALTAAHGALTNSTSGTTDDTLAACTLTNSTGGTADGTLAAVPSDTLANVATACNNNFTEVATELTDINNNFAELHELTDNLRTRVSEIATILQKVGILA